MRLSSAKIKHVDRIIEMLPLDTVTIKTFTLREEKNSPPLNNI